MTTYFQVNGASGEVAIDDQFECPKFLAKYRVVAKDSSSAATPAGDYLLRLDYQKYLPYRNVYTFMRFKDLRSIGVDMDTTDDSVREFASNILIFIKPITANSGYSVDVKPRFKMATSGYRAEEFGVYKSSDGYYELQILLYANVQNFEALIALYTTAPLIPAKNGILVFNAQSKLLFDGTKGYLQHVKTLSGGIKVGSNVSIAGSYSVTLPTNLNVDHLFISCKSPLPYYGADNINNKGVSVDFTFYYPTFTVSSKTLKIDIKAEHVVTYSNTNAQLNQFFETLIYCPFPEGITTLTP
ncbi:hypothetical protein [Acinetobacter pollinis]|uniref:Uncharacterized protein n=1 Tax=Acinetobacter pollinis TaxID=2605270 RepID=A0ABU6DQ76_9GAMM|nr:hypothetical protein [Acinetobacter pollinis]MEB5476006.1 hypothetical protein [Acinetobacter pollinis]